MVDHIGRLKGQSEDDYCWDIHVVVGYYKLNIGIIEGNIPHHFFIWNVEYPFITFSKCLSTKVYKRDR